MSPADAEAEPDADALGASVWTVAVGGGGRISSCWVDAALKVTFGEPPKNAVRMGVARVKCPMTRTVTVLPRAAEQSGVHVTEMSAGAIVTTELLASRIVRQTIRFVAPPAGHG